MGKGTNGISSEALRFLESYPWPGNVRELENAIERAVALEKTSEITRDSLPERVVLGLAAPPSYPFRVDLPEEGLDLQRHIEQVERTFLEAALARSNGVRTQAADMLKMSYRSFRHYAKKYGL
ncbi:MAG: hypothetical protein HY648_06220 [Acidobacteria bacterium]|nr:hypothetical protein [Acidobacteriota bacterium]